MKFFIFQDHQKEWRWFLQAENVKKIAESSEAYHNERDCLDAISLVMVTNHQTPVNFV